MHVHSNFVFTMNDRISCFSAHTQTHLGVNVHIIIGASTGCGVVILLILITCTFLCIVQKPCKKRRNNVEQMDSFNPNLELEHKLGELNHDTNIPQYETISPLYDVIPDNIDHSEIYLRMMSNNAYSESAKCIQ